MEIEDNVKQCLLSRGFTEKQLLNNRGLIGATIDETVKLLAKPAVSVPLPLNGDKDKIIKFFKTEYELGFCSKKYYERVKWYFDTYEHELFSSSGAVGGNEC